MLECINRKSLGCYSGCNFFCFSFLADSYSNCYVCHEKSSEEEERYHLTNLILQLHSLFFFFLNLTNINLIFASERKQLGSLLAKVHRSELNISYETLEKATNYFHSSHKLGQGGSGSVYKVLSSFLLH